jgi:hypothetical protein
MINKDLEDIIMKANQEVLDITTKSVTRFEVIDHTSKKRGRIVVEYNVNVELSLQDENRTLKVFLTDKNAEYDRRYKTAFRKGLLIH